MVINTRYASNKLSIEDRILQGLHSLINENNGKGYGTLRVVVKAGKPIALHIESVEVFREDTAYD